MDHLQGPPVYEFPLYSEPFFLYKRILYIQETFFIYKVVPYLQEPFFIYNGLLYT